MAQKMRFLTLKKIVRRSDSVPVQGTVACLSFSLNNKQLPALAPIRRTPRSSGHSPLTCA
jgi:hypothetical protein